jgi:Icc-related predicted phosphoesterase
VRILHLSDTHGQIPDLAGDSDVVVHTGDFCPNRSFANEHIERAFQPYWLEEHAADFRRVYGRRKVLIVSGNHDYVSVAHYLREAGVDAEGIDDKFAEVNGVSFYGFPWTPIFCGWNHMASENVIEFLLAKPKEWMANERGIDVFCAHGPMYGVLDRNSSGERCGSKAVRAAMQDARCPPRLFLHGHIHEAAGRLAWSRGMVVSNAACTQRVLTIDHQGSAP